jgi:ligand-binding sensor domain-containing protein/signal transduction histidine kinase
MIPDQQKMVHITYIILFLLLYIINPPERVFSQPENLKFHHLTIEDGLSNSDVTCITQDKNGFIWIGTADGLNRFDGYTVKVYRHDQEDTSSLSNSMIFSLLVDSDGDLWIGTNNGLSMYNKDKNIFINYYHDANNTSSISSSLISYITEDNDHNLWIATQDNGLNLFNKKNNTFIRYYWNQPNTNNLSLNNIKTVFIDQEDNIWTGTFAGLGLYQSQKKQFTLYKPDADNRSSISDSLVYSLCQDKDGRIWIGTWNGGINLFDKEKNSFIRYKAAYPDNHVRAIYLDSKNNMWAGVRGGLKLYDRTKNIFYLYSHDENDDASLLDNNIQCIFEDIQGNLWFGHTKAGVSYVTVNKKFISFNLKTTGSRNEKIVSSILEDKNKNLWIGYFVGGIDLFNRKNNKITRFRPHPDDKNSIGAGTVFAIYEDSKNNIWVGTYLGGLSLFNKEKGTFSHYKHNPDDPESIAGNDIRYIIEDDRNNLWLTVHGRGVNMFDQKNRIFYHYSAEDRTENSILSNWVWPIYQDHKKGNIWIGTSRGLSILDQNNETFENYSYNDREVQSLSNNMINTIFEDSGGNMWIGTNDGLNLFQRDKKNFTRFFQKDGLANNVINTILEDDHGNLWISTNHGISKFNPQDRTFRNFDKMDGLQGNEFSARACFKNKRGEMFFGGSSGFNVFYPDSIKDNMFIPPVVITEFLLFNQPVRVGKSINGRSILKKSITETDEIELRYKDKVISFEYTALQYNSPEKNKYAYMMEGFEEEWNYAGNRRFVTYSGLPPGDYLFKVKASNNDGIWNENGSSIKLTITPPLWQTWWFRIMGVILLSGLILAMHKIRTARIQAHNRELEQHVKERTAQLESTNKELEAFSYSVSHDLRAPLRGMDGFSQALLEDYSQKLDKKGRDYLHRIQRGSQRMGELIDNLLKLSRFSRIEMYFKKVNMSHLVKSITQEYKKMYPKRNVEFIIAKDLYARGDPSLLRVMLKNLIDNAWKFTSKSPYPKIEFGTEIKKRKKVFYLRDNGIGFDMSNSDNLFEMFLYQHSGLEGTGIGLATVQRIINRHNGSIWAEGKVNEGAIFYFTIGKKIT